MRTKKRIGILTGGGDVQPLNAVIASVKRAAESSNIEVLGFLNGWQGLLENSYISLSKIKISEEIGGTILKSSRVNIAKVTDGAMIARNNLEKLSVDGLIVVGGEDTLSNSFHLMNYPQVLISKTIDNDVGQIRMTNSYFSLSNIVNHFTLGHPTAAGKIASFVSYQEGVRTTAYSHKRIIVVESMGMHAGWLALSSCMGNPDFIIIPEFPVNYELFKEQVVKLYRKQEHVIIVIAEGARWADGAYLSADETEKDGFGHPRFKGAATVLAEKLKKDLSDKFDTRNVNSVNPSYLYRSGRPCTVDMKCARVLGEQAVKLLNRKLSEPKFLSLKLEAGLFKVEPISLSAISSIENFHRFIDNRMYDSGNYCAAINAKKYWNTIMSEYPKISYGI